jgi:hypothetical protein
LGIGQTSRDIHAFLAGVFQVSQRNSSASRTWSLARSRRPACWIIFLGLAWTATALADPPLADPQSQAEMLTEQIQPLLAQYCGDCHSPDYAAGEVDVSLFKSVEAALQHRDFSAKVSEILQFGAMPPDDAAQPAETERRLLVSWFNAVLTVDCDQVRDPGRVTIRRLNRPEYNHTIRDLTGLELDLAADFPSDDVGEGFDNIGDVLSLPPLLLEKYLDAAFEIAQQVVKAESIQVPRQRRERGDLTAVGAVNLRGGRHFFFTSHGVVFGEFTIERDGDFVLQVETGAEQAGGELAKVEFSIDGQRVHVAEVKAPVDRMEIQEFPLRLTAGKRRFSAAFINDYYNPDANDPGDRDRNLAVGALEIVGPVGPSRGETALDENHVLVAVPGDDLSPRKAARQILERFAFRAFRRPVQPEEIDRLLELVGQALDRGRSFEDAIQVGIAATLVSPHFLFRVEDDRVADPAEPIRELNDFELASRLSYFLWSSMPDDELFQLASDGQLRRPPVLEAQVRRMIADPKSASLVENFGGQWLNLRNLEDVTPDPQRFPGFDAALKRAMRRETELMFETIMREDRSVSEFLTADFTFVNQRLAEHYGIDGVQGDDFQQVKLPADQRAGLLTQASILTLTSNPTRTSAVKRGLWIMENILGTPPPDPPPNVPELEEAQEASGATTLREQLVLHRQNAVCASCHIQMDELGFGFENFDPIGRWRMADGGRPIDSSGELPNGQRFQGPIELVAILSQREQEFAKVLASRMLTFALGRGLEYHDQCAVDSIAQQMQQNDYRFSSLVLGIVTSEPFRMRRTQGE